MEYGDYAQAHARLPEEVPQIIMSPERRGNQGANIIKRDIPKPVRIERPV